ncbi:hypothetical protein [Aeromonas jandaei]|uniref:hypothetical protein n=1 Tax=Aeromonas jandaei TaxID=650 RepID=UPI003BA3A2D3
MSLKKGLVLITAGWFCHASAVLAVQEESLANVVLGHKPVLKQIMLPDVIESNSEVTISFDSEDKDKDDAIGYDVTYKIRERDGKTVIEYHAQSDDNKLNIKIPDGSYGKSVLFEVTPRNISEKRPYLGDKVSTAYKPIKGVISSPHEKDAKGNVYGDNAHIAYYKFSKANDYCQRQGWRLATATEVRDWVISKGFGKGLKDNGLLRYSVEKWDGGHLNIAKGPYNFRFVVARDDLSVKDIKVFIDVFENGWSYHEEYMGGLNFKDYGNAYVCVH